MYHKNIKCAVIRDAKFTAINFSTRMRDSPVSLAIALVAAGAAQQDVKSEQLGV